MPHDPSAWTLFFTVVQELHIKNKQRNQPSKHFFWNSNAQVSLKRNYAQVWNLFYKNIINNRLEKDRHTIFLLTL